jgi:CheY-like chemotaxis protein
VQYGGSGLGLFISRELTELQGGEIGVESESGRGSTFAFYVVARRAKPPLDRDGAAGMKRGSDHARNRSAPASSVKTATQHLAKAASIAQNGTSGSASKGGGRMKVLIIEDNLVNQRVLQRQLENLGMEVHLANHGGEALDKLRQSTYWADGDTNGQRLELGVLLMDQEMPVMDGLTCTTKIRELEQEGKLTGHVPIIAVTANARTEQVQTALDAGMVSRKLWRNCYAWWLTVSQDDVVSKPFRIKELIPKIEELLEQYPAPEE